MSMRMKLPGVLLGVFALLGAAAPAFAHHQFGVEYDAKKCADLKGTLSAIDWENPHAYVHIDVKDASGKTATWRLEMITPNALKRNGTTRADFLDNMGKPATAWACPTKAGGTQNKGAAVYVKLSDGILRIVGQNVGGRRPDQLDF
jgi:Family of unknown function (DUF6152)